MRFASAILLTLPSITLFFSYSPTLGAPILSQSPTTGDLGPPPSLDIQDTQHAKSTLAHARFGLAVAAARHQLSVNTGDLAPHNEDTIRARGMGLSMVPDIEMVLARRIADEISDLHHRREITEPMPVGIFSERPSYLLIEATGIRSHRSYQFLRLPLRRGGEESQS